MYAGNHFYSNEVSVYYIISNCTHHTLYILHCYKARVMCWGNRAFNKPSDELGATAWTHCGR